MPALKKEEGHLVVCVCRLVRKLTAACRDGTAHLQMLPQRFTQPRIEWMTCGGQVRWLKGCSHSQRRRAA